ncbi:MAG: AraC family transcriptional regulator [Oscillospiraceae bacterium]|nr:AraC family transcriptional regulator [Oscillospiraceae bacterium]
MLFGSEIKISTTYEHHKHSDPDFPVIFHRDKLKNDQDFLMHWHENIEILYFRRGSAVVECDTVPVYSNAGDIVLINSSSLHYIHSITPQCEYDCLIADKMFCESHGFRVGEIHINSPINDLQAGSFFDSICSEISEKNQYYKIAVKAYLVLILARIFMIAKNDLVASAGCSNHKLDMVCDSIDFIRKHYKQDITVDQICEHAGFSKYYFCRTFREITGKTVVDTVNYLRCENARRLLLTGRYNISECAELSGFNNKSYFSRIYKRYMGCLPSEDEERQSRS